LHAFLSQHADAVTGTANAHRVWHRFNLALAVTYNGGGREQRCRLECSTPISWALVLAVDMTKVVCRSKVHAESSAADRKTNGDSAIRTCMDVPAKGMQLQ
jgi:hypothetical protein